MTHAAKQAGITNATLVYEPQYAAAFIAQTIRLLPKVPRPQIGDVFLVCDPGGGTGDFVSYRVVGQGAAAHELELRVEGRPEGSLCGSQHINERFLKWLRGNADFTAWCSRVGLSVEDALRKANEGFEIHKKEFFDTGMRPDDICIQSPTSQEVWHVTVTSDLMVAFWTPVLDTIKSHINSQFTAETTLIVLAGAISRSDYFMKHIEAFKDMLNVQHKTDCRILDGAREAGHSMSHMVCLGAHYKYGNIRPCDAPAAELFAIALDEELDISRYDDVIYQTNDIKQSGCRQRGRPAPNPGKVFRGEAGGRTFVRDRICLIVDPITPRIAGQPHIIVKWERNWVDFNDTSDLGFQVYWINPDAPGNKGGGPIFERVPSGEEYSLGNPIYKNSIHGGIYLWGSPVKIPLPHFAELGFEVTVIPETKREKQRGGRRHRNQTEEKSGGKKHKGYVYLTRTEITCDGPNVQYKVQMVMPGKEPFIKHEADTVMDRDDNSDDNSDEDDDGDEDNDDRSKIWDQILDTNATMQPEDLYDLEEASLVDERFNPTARE